MKNISNEYKHHINDSNITLSEYNRSITFENKDRVDVIKVHIDGEVCTTNTTIRCDYLITDKDEHHEIFIELKGKNIPHAIDQIRQSISDYGEYEEGRSAYIICSKCHPSIRTSIQAKKTKLLKDFNTKLNIKENSTVKLFQS